MIVALIEKCEDCVWCVSDYTADTKTLPHVCDSPLLRAVIAVNPDSPPPENCPLLDLDVVLDKVKENCMYDVNYLGGSACRVWKAAIEAARAELKGGGD